MGKSKELATYAGGTFSTDVILGGSADISMDASSSGQLSIDGNGYNGAIALDSTGMSIYHNSASRSLSLGTNETARLTIDASGRVTMPYQPCLSIGAAPAASVPVGNWNNWGGGGYIFTNIGNNWNDLTKTFTAPVAGVYHVSVGIRMSSQAYTSGGQYNYLQLINTNNAGAGAPIRLWSPANEPYGYRPHELTAIMPLNANDTVSPLLTLSAGTANLDGGHSGQTDTFFRVYLLG